MYLVILRVLELVPAHLHPLADRLYVRGGVSQEVEQGLVVVRAETKEQVNEGVEIQG